MKKEHRVLFDPITINKLKIKNRFVMAPMGPGGLCDADGTYNERGVEFYVERAKGGTGLLMTGVTMIENDIEKCSLPSLPCPTLNPLNFVRTGKLLTERVHAYDTKIFLQLSAGFGRVSIPSIVGKTAVSCSPIPHRWIDGVTCRELSVDEIKIYIKKFTESASIAKRAGFDGVEVHAVHEGYLLDQFAISFFNKRTDEYNGDLKNRLRFAIEVVKAIKEVCGNDFPVSLRYSLKSFIKDWKKGALPGEDFIEKGRDIEEGLEAAKILEIAGYDAFNVDVGSYESWHWSHPPMYHKKGLYLPYSKMLKQVLNVPIITAGRMDDPDLSSAAIVDRMTDMVALGRPLLADAEIPNKIMSDKYEEIRPCLSCQEGCMGRLAKYAMISCAVNPICGRENEYGLKITDKLKKVFIIGGGVAGCEAARVSALRGHKVVLYEKNNVLGGQLVLCRNMDFKKDHMALVAWYTRELKALNVDVHLEAKVSSEMIKELDTDATIFVATGSRPRMLNIAGGSQNIYSVDDILVGKKYQGNSVVIIGGGTVGCEVALWLTNNGKQVTIVEKQDDILKDGTPLCHANEGMLRDLIAFKKIDVKLNNVVVSVADGTVVLKSGEQEESIKADTVILAAGYVSCRDLFDVARHNHPKTYLIGDAKQVKNIMYAIWDAYEIARNI